jgi:hypothetical protein
LPMSSVTVNDALLRGSAQELLYKVIDGWKIKSAVLHLEAFIGPEGLIFCEVAARPGGAGIVDAFEATRGINLDHAKILIDCGDNPIRLRSQPRFAHAGFTLHHSSGGTLEDYDDSAVAHFAFRRRISVQPGQSVPRSRFSGTGLSTHIFAHEAQEEVLRMIQSAEANIRFTVNPTLSHEVVQ